MKSHWTVPVTEQIPKFTKFKMTVTIFVKSSLMQIKISKTTQKTTFFTYLLFFFDVSSTFRYPKGTGNILLLAFLQE